MRRLMLLPLLLSLSACGDAMSFGSKNEIYLFSAVKGQLTYNGEVTDNIMVRRWVQYDGKQYEDRIETDQAGIFVFDAIRKSERSILPREFLSHQKLYVTWQGEEILIWETIKRSEEENAELEGKALDFSCELTDEPRFVHRSLHSIGTLCHWKRYRKALNRGPSKALCRLMPVAVQGPTGLFLRGGRFLLF